MKPKCLIEHCTNESKTRGVCASHYAILSDKVRREEITWPQLEQYNMTLPLKRIKKSLVQKQLDKIHLNLLRRKKN